MHVFVLNYVKVYLFILFSMQNFFSKVHTALCVIIDTAKIIVFVDKLTDI